METTVLPARTLGDLSVSAMGLGCMGMSMAYGRADKAEACRVIDRAIELGINFFDTADVYGNGDNEFFLGRCLGGRRQQVVLATKFGCIPHPLTGLINRLDGSAKHCRQSIEASLRRLRTDYVDLYYLHRVDPKTPIEESVGAMADLVKAGKVRHLGLSECSAATLRRANAIHPITAVQSEWSIFTRDVERSVLPVARELKVGLVPFSPLSRGLLTGAPSAYTRLSFFDMRSHLPRWQKQNLEANLALVQRIQEIARLHNVTPGQVALAWVLARGEDVVPIPGTKRIAYLEENIDALRVRLPKATLDELTQMRATGARYPEHSVTGGETLS